MVKKNSHHRYAVNVARKNSSTQSSDSTTVKLATHSGMKSYKNNYWNC